MSAHAGRRLRWAVAALALVALLAYLRDPPWLGRVTSGLSAWMEDGGVRFRWTTGHATFYVPSEVREIAIPIRALRGTPDFLPVTVQVDIDGRPAHALQLEDERWREVLIPIGAARATRRHRRIELRVSRTHGRFYRGVQVGEIRTD